LIGDFNNNHQPQITNHQSKIKNLQCHAVPPIATLREKAGAQEL
jgi:hypothetical protein